MPSENLQPLAPCLLINTLLVRSFIQNTILLAWVIFLHAYAAFGADLKAPNIADLVPRPEIRLYPHYLSLDDMPSDLKRDTDFGKLQTEVFEKIAKNEFESAYVELAKFIEFYPNFPYNDWLSFLKADLLLRVQNKLEGGNLNLALEEYELAVRLFPLHGDIPRALYQIALIKLYTGLYKEANDVVQRALTDFPQSVYIPEYYLISAEQAFLATQYDEALLVFDLIVRKFPRHSAAIDAAFRKAFLHFTRGNYKTALETYQALENYHSAEFAVLRMQKDSASPIKLQDRLFYGEALYLTDNYADASEVFQALANLFPKHENAAYAWIRFGDSFFKREKYLAAQKVYEYVIEEYASNLIAKSFARIKLYEAVRHTNFIRFQSEVEDGLSLAATEAQQAEAVLLDEYANGRLVEYFLGIGSFVKAQKILVRMKKDFLNTPNASWIQQKYTEVLEREILDYYHEGDLLATLTTYLVNEKDVSIKFKNIPILIKIADAARDLELLDKSEEILNRVVYLESSSMARQEAILKLIDILIAKNDLRRASERLRRFNFAYPGTSLKFLYEKAWGELYSALGKPEKAIGHFEDSVKLAAGQAGGIVHIRHNYLRLGELYTQVNLPLKAIDSYNRYLSLYANKERVKLGGIPVTKKDSHFLTVSRYRIADLYFEMHDYIQALGAYRTVSEEVTEEPFRSHALYRIGECYLALNDREAAIESFRKVKSEDPNNLWLRAAQSYIQSVEMEVKHGIRIFN